MRQKGLAFAREIADVLRAVSSGAIPVTSFAEGAVSYDLAAAGWSIEFFNDAGDIDYVEAARAPDGRFAEFSDFSDTEELRAGAPIDPLDLLSNGEIDALYQRLGVKRLLPSHPS